MLEDMSSVFIILFLSLIYAYFCKVVMTLSTQKAPDNSITNETTKTFPSLGIPHERRAAHLENSIEASMTNQQVRNGWLCMVLVFHFLIRE